HRDITAAGARPGSRLPGADGSRRQRGDPEVPDQRRGRPWGGPAGRHRRPGEGDGGGPDGPRRGGREGPPPRGTAHPAVRRVTRPADRRYFTLTTWPVSPNRASSSPRASASSWLGN